MEGVRFRARGDRFMCIILALPGVCQTPPEGIIRNSNMYASTSSMMCLPGGCTSAWISAATAVNGASFPGQLVLRGAKLRSEVDGLQNSYPSRRSGLIEVSPSVEHRYIKIWRMWALSTRRSIVSTHQVQPIGPCFTTQHSRRSSSAESELRPGTGRWGRMLESQDL